MYSDRSFEKRPRGEDGRRQREREYSVKADERESEVARMTNTNSNKFGRDDKRSTRHNDQDTRTSMSHNDEWLGRSRMSRSSSHHSGLRAWASTNGDDRADISPNDRGGDGRRDANGQNASRYESRDYSRHRHSRDGGCGGNGDWHRNRDRDYPPRGPENRSHSNGDGFRGELANRSGDSHSHVKGERTLDAHRGTDEARIQNAPAEIIDQQATGHSHADRRHHDGSSSSSSRQLEGGNHRDRDRDHRRRGDDTRPSKRPRQEEDKEETRGRSKVRQHSKSLSRSLSTSSSTSSHHHRRSSTGKRRRRNHSSSTSRSTSPERKGASSKRHKGKERKGRDRSASQERDKDRKKRKKKDKEEKRSVLTGKKIKLKIKKDHGDHERDANRRDLLQFLNSTFE